MNYERPAWGHAAYRGERMNYETLQANGLFHTSPRQRPGFIARFALAGQRPASCQARMSRAFSAPDGFWGHEPRALPWADMSDALGVSIRGSFLVLSHSRFWDSLHVSRFSQIPFTFHVSRFTQIPFTFHVSRTFQLPCPRALITV